MIVVSGADKMAQVRCEAVDHDGEVVEPTDEIDGGIRTANITERQRPLGNCRQRPRFRTAKKLVDMTKPDEVAPRYACHLSFDMPSGVVGIAEGPQRLEARFDETKVPKLGIAIRKRTGSGLARALTLQPAIGTPDVLSHGAGVSAGVPWLEPGETREWEISWRTPAE